jgi:hypothetical protein
MDDPSLGSMRLKFRENYVLNPAIRITEHVRMRLYIYFNISLG